jgi:hypothetical protein
MSKRHPRPVEPDLTTLTSLNEWPAVATAEADDRAAPRAHGDLDAEARVLEQRLQSDDPVTRAEARATLERLAPELRLAAVRAKAARARAEAVRSEAARAVVVANRPVFEARLRRIAATWAAAEAETADTLAWAHQLAERVGYAAVDGLFTTLPAGLLPGVRQEWIDACRRHQHYDVS